MDQVEWFLKKLREKTKRAIARDLIEAGELQKALEIAKCLELEDDRRQDIITHIAKNFALAGDIERARKLTEEVNVSSQAKILITIAKRSGEKKDLEQAIEIVDKLRQTSFRDRMLSDIVEYLTDDVNDPERARKLAEEIRDTSLQGSHVKLIAMKQKDLSKALK